TQIYGNNFSNGTNSPYVGHTSVMDNCNAANPMVCGGANFTTVADPTNGSNMVLKTYSNTPAYVRAEVEVQANISSGTTIYSKYRIFVPSTYFNSSISWMTVSQRAFLYGPNGESNMGIGKDAFPYNYAYNTGIGDDMVMGYDPNFGGGDNQWDTCYNDGPYYG